MRIRKLIPVGQIIVDRWPYGLRTLALIKHIEKNGTGELPPIHVQPQVDGRYKILDGRHRVLAFRMLQFPYIEARYGIKEKEGYGTDLEVPQGATA